MRGPVWYFLTVDKRELFAIRPWWGRHIVVDLSSGDLVTDIGNLKSSIAAKEREHVMGELTQAADDLEKGNERELYDRIPTVLPAIYLAGCNRLREAGPLIEKLQKSNYSGSSRLSMQFITTKQLGIDPKSNVNFTLRQIAHLSLRRLEIRPQPVSLTKFEVRASGEGRMLPYEPKSRPRDRANNVPKVKKSMTPEEIIDLIGEPDYVIGGGIWEYDIDAKSPYTFIIKWDERKIIDIEKRAVPLWKEGDVRDRRLIMLN